MTTLDPSIQNIVDFARGISPRLEIKPVDLLPGGKYQVPAGFQVNIDTFTERVWLYGPHNEDGVLLKTLVQYGGEFKVLGVDLVRGLTQLMNVGEPTGKRVSLDERQQYFVRLLAASDPFPMPEKALMTRAEMDRHVETCEACRPVYTAFIAAVDAGVSYRTDAHFREMIAKAHANAKDALAFYGRKAKAMKPAAFATAQEA